MKRVRVSEIVRETGLSRATIDRALNKRPGVHPRTEELIGRAIERLSDGWGADEDASRHADRKVDLVIRLGRGLTDQFLSSLPGLPARIGLHDMHQKGEDEIFEIVRELCQDAEVPLVLAAKNDERLCLELARARSRGKRVVTLISDLRPSARDAFVGIDNRMAGQTAAYLIGHLLIGPEPKKAAVVLGDYAFRCHEDREIGFRSLLRTAYPSVTLTDAAKGEDSPDQTYAAVAELIRAHPDLDAIYNVAGGNQGLAHALDEAGVAGRIVVVSHETNRVTLPLLRSGVIAFLIAQSPRELLGAAIDLALAEQYDDRHTFGHLDFGVYTPFNVPNFNGSTAE